MGLILDMAVHTIVALFVGVSLIFIIVCNAIVSQARYRRRKEWQRGVRGADESSNT